MIRPAALRTLALSACLACALPPARAQDASANQAVLNEEARRQEAAKLLTQKLADADRDVAAGRIADAARRYDEALELAGRVGPSAAAAGQQAAAGVVSTRLQLASRAQSRGYLSEAEAHVARVLKVDPRNTEAAALKQQLDAALARRRGLTPSPDAVSQLPAIQQKNLQVATLVQDARLFYEAGEIALAEERVTEALRLDPSHAAANYYMRLILEAKNAQLVNQREITSRQGLIKVEQVWNRPLNRDNLPPANPFARTNLVHTSKGRQQIRSKLERIVLDEIKFDELPLSEVVRQLKDESRARDPEQLGINFFINPFLDSSPPVGATAVDPNTGQLIALPPPEQVNLNDVTVNIDPPLHRVTMWDLLDAISKAASSPVKFTIEDYAVVFTHKPAERAQLITRFFKVNPNTFQMGLENVFGITFGDFAVGSSGQGGGGGGGGQGGQGQGVVGTIIPRVQVTGNILQGGQGGGGGGGLGGQQGATNGLRGITYVSDQTAVQDQVRAFFLAAGVNLLPPNAVFFNDRLGVLMVRATLEEIEIVQQAVETLNMAPPMVQIEAKFAEVSQNDLKALGFDWFLGNTLMLNNRAGVQGGTAPSFQGQPSTANPSGVFPTPPVGQQGTDGQLTAGLRNFVGENAPTPTLATLTGLLTDPQFRVAIRALEQRGGAELMSAPSITTLSGRQAQVQIAELQSVVTGLNLNQTAATGGGTGTIGGGGVAAGGGAVATQTDYNVQIIPLGPVLDVIPYVNADGYTIEMALLPSFTEFLGYDDPGPFVAQATSVAGNTISAPLTAQLPLPRFRVRQVTTSAIVWDGQTVVIGGLIAESVRRIRDKVPFLGDIPFVGRLFRSESTAADKKNLMVFITPTIVDPAGNPVHTPDNLPFDPRLLPSQEPVQKR